MRIVYGALAAGVALFALVAFLLLPDGVSDLDPDVVRWVWLGVAVVAIFGAGILRGRLDPSRAGAARVRTTAVAVWALAEGQALLGLVARFLTGDSTTAIMALLVFAYLFVRHRPGAFLLDRPARPGSSAGR